MDIVIGFDTRQITLRYNVGLSPEKQSGVKATGIKAEGSRLKAKDSKFLR